MSKKKIDTEGLAIVLQELDELDHVEHRSKQQAARHATLIAQAAAIRDGSLRLKDILREEANERARAIGVPEVEDEQPSKRELRAKAWQRVLSFANGDIADHEERAAAARKVEQRDSMLTTHGIGNSGDTITTQIGTYTGLGFFVPTGFMDKLINSLAAHDAIFDDDVVTVVRTGDGRAFPIPYYSDINNVASVVAESSTTTETDIAEVNHAVVAAYTYKTPRFTVSLEAIQDINSVQLTVKNIFKRFAYDRFTRGAGKDLTVGKVGGPTGFIPSILAAGCPVVTAAGSNANDGGGGTGTTTIGTADLMNTIKKLNPAYLASDKVRWAMNWNTWTTLTNLSDKQGGPLAKAGGVIDVSNRTIHGLKVAIMPSMDDIAAKANPIVLGDFSYWLTRLVDNVEDGPTGIMVYKDAPGYAENGKVGLRAFFRADGTLLWSPTGDAAATSPFVILANHS